MYRNTFWETNFRQLSDVLRLLVLERFGGAYLDSDTASRAPVPTDLPDFIMKDRLYEINGAVMQMRRGHPFLRLAIRDMGRGKIDYRKRNDLGPIHLSALRKRYCPKPNRKDPDKRVEFSCPGM